MATDVVEPIAGPEPPRWAGRSAKGRQDVSLAVAAVAALAFVVWLVVYLTSGPRDGSYACRADEPGGSAFWTARVEHGRLVHVYADNGGFPHVWTVSSMDTTLWSDAFDVTVNGELTLSCVRPADEGD